jgi:alanine racemase
LGEVVRLGLTQTVFNPAGAKALSEAAGGLGKRVPIHIKIDTGMSRLGFLPRAESIDAICEIARDPCLDVQGIYTHCATSDALSNGFVYEQQNRFHWVLAQLKKRGLDIPVKHISNSGAVAQTLRPSGFPGLFMDAVRVGILLYGLPPSHEMAEICLPLGLKPAMRLYSQVSMVKELAAGVGISYGHLFTTTRPTTIAVIPVGYADGYPRRLTHGGRVRIRGRFAPIVGAICMDQCMADVTDIPGVTPGDTVHMLGTPEEGIGADNLADIVGTISYEIVCGIGKRVPRVYINGN